MTNAIKFSRAGKAIGGGKLTHAKRDGKVVAHINETSSGFWMVHIGTAPFIVAHSMDEARALIIKAVVS